MVTRSAGVLLTRRRRDREVFVAHMGGPFWARKDAGAWSIPKGEFDPAAESAESAARREFTEELGIPFPAVDLTCLGEVRITARKVLTVFTADAPDFAPAEFDFGAFEMEWPPRSGRTARFPEVDRAEWMPIERARELLAAGQRGILDLLDD